MCRAPSQPLGITGFQTDRCSSPACGIFDSESDLSANGALYCADFDVTDNGITIFNDKEHCACVPNAQTPATFLDAVCENAEDAAAGADVNCAIDGSAVDQNEDCDPDSSNEPANSGDGTGNEPEDCTHFDPIDGECCDPTIQTDCCEGPENSQQCVGYDFGGYTHTAPGPNPPFEQTITNGEISLTVHGGTADENDDDEGMDAAVAYGFYDCGETTCPFYLASLSMAARADLDVSVRYNGMRKTKHVEDLRADLLFPVLGEWNTSTNAVSFAQDRVVYAISFTLSGSEFGSENGFYWKALTNSDTVTGTVNPTTKLVEWDNSSFSIAGLPGSVTAEIKFNGNESLTGSPPSASGTVGSVSCTSSAGGDVALDGTSTDPDSDLAYEAWRIDGTLVYVGSSSHTESLTNGSYEYELRAVDSRGAFDQATGTIEVDCD